MHKWVLIITVLYNKDAFTIGLCKSKINQWLSVLDLSWSAIDLLWSKLILHWSTIDKDWSSIDL